MTSFDLLVLLVSFALHIAFSVVVTDGLIRIFSDASGDIWRDWNEQ